MDGAPDDTERSAPGDARPAAGRIPVVRVAAVLVLFVVGTVLLLATIHPSHSALASSSQTTSTSVGAASPATTTGASASSASPTSAPSGHGHRSTATTVPPKPPANVSVVVANGSGVTGAASAFTTRLSTAGWTTAPPINATMQVSTSHVYYAAGQQAAAAQVASELGMPSSAVAPYTTSAPVSSIGNADVVVVLGPDVATPSSVSTSPTTTVSSSRSSTG